MLGVLFSNVKGCPIKERLYLLLSRNIPSTITHPHTPPQHHALPNCPVGFCGWSLASLIALCTF